jgi:hypothetical protein
MIKEVWLNRSKEWIEQNPNQGTMYKATLDFSNTKEDTSSLVQSTRKYIKKKSVKAIAGIYCISCTKTNSAYIGQSTNIQSRIRQHKYNLLKNNSTKHPIVYSKMRKDLEKYGIESFEFLTIEIVDDPTYENLVVKENEFMQSILTKGITLYNLYVPHLNNIIWCPEHLKAKAAQFIQDNL